VDASVGFGRRSSRPRPGTRRPPRTTASSSCSARSGSRQRTVGAPPNGPESSTSNGKPARSGRSDAAAPAVRAALGARAVRRAATTTRSGTDRSGTDRSGTDRVRH